MKHFNLFLVLTFICVNIANSQALFITTWKTEGSDSIYISNGLIPSFQNGKIINNLNELTNYLSIATWKNLKCDKSGFISENSQNNCNFQSSDCPLACNDLVNYGLDSECKAIIIPEDLIEGENSNVDCNYKIYAITNVNNEIVGQEGSNGTWILTGEYIGQTLTVKIGYDPDINNYCYSSVKLEDHIAPIFDSPPNMTFNCLPNICQADILLPNIENLFDNCDENPQWWITSDAGNISGDMNNNGFVDDGEIWSILGVEMGNYIYNYFSIDQSGNYSQRTSEFWVYDYVPPIPLCESNISISLDYTGTANILAENLDSGSFDNCNPIWFKVLRVNADLEYDGGCPDLNGDDEPQTPNINDVWYDDEVFFCCEDNNSEVLAQLQIFELDPGPGPVNPNRMIFGGDLDGHFSFCTTVISIGQCFDCSFLWEPFNYSTNVPINTNLLWNEVEDATGYKLSIGTASGATDILNKLDVGNVTTYDPENDFPCGTEIFVKITPYNEFVEAQDCIEESFTTENIIANAGSDVSYCNGGSVQLQASGGNVYSWTPITGLNNPNISNPVASPPTTTLYTVTVSKDGRCPDTDEVLVSLNPIIAPNVSATPETANNANDGTATSNPTGGTAPYTYLWSNGATTQSISGLSPGFYTVTVTDANICTATGTAIITEFGCSGLSLNTIQQDVKCYGECNGSINISNVQNGTAPYTYLWSNGQTSSFIENLCAGIYNVIVTDSKGCVIQGTFTIIEPSQLSVTATGTSETENGANDGTATASASGGVSPYVYHWSNGQTTQTITGLAPGDYNVVVIDSNQCKVSDIISVGSVGCDSLIINHYQINESCAGYCDGAIAILCIENAEYPVKYKWSTGSEAPLVNNLCAREYTVTITDSNNCSSIAKFTIISESQINISIDSIINITSTTAGAIFLSVDAGNYTISWTGPNNFSSTLVSLTNLQKPGCYTLVITDNDTGCTLDTTICILDLTGTNDLFGFDKVIIYPNPTNDYFVVDFSASDFGNAKIFISDLSGRDIMSEHKAKFDKAVRFNTQNFNAGLYIVRIEMKNNAYYRKVEIVR